MYKSIYECNILYAFPMLSPKYVHVRYMFLLIFHYVIVVLKINDR